jgi:hypothetical protein
MLAARFAAEKSGMTEQQARIVARNKLSQETKPDYSHQTSDLVALFPLPITAEQTKQLSLIETDGSSRYLPKWDSIPENMRGERGELSYHHHLVKVWFFRGLHDIEQQQLHHKIGVDRDAALRIIRHTLVAMDSSIQDKFDGCAYLLHAWFEIKVNTNANN